MPQLVHELIARSAGRTPEAPAIFDLSETNTELCSACRSAACFRARLARLGLARAERVAIYQRKRFEAVVVCLALRRPAAFVKPINPPLKAEQVGYILQDCNVRDSAHFS